MKKYKVAYATGSRADYGIVKNYLKLLNEDEEIDFSILVTGTHLEKKYGYSVDIIKKYGFRIDVEIPLQIRNTTNEMVIHSMAAALDAFGEFFGRNKYDLLIILGDRYEMMSVAIAAAMQKIPIVHLHGGEITYGNYDEFMRHSITKMSQYHFTSTEEYKKRVIQLGENPDNVFYLGALGAENCKKIDENLVVDEIKAMKDKKYWVVAFHPETLTDANVNQQISELLSAINKKIEEEKFIFIGSNSDTSSDEIRDSLRCYVNEMDNAIYYENLNVDSFLYLVKNSLAIIGNSSSGIIEAPSLGSFTINIGDRQKGRVSGDSVINVSCNEVEILGAMDKINRSIEENKEISNPYYKPNTAKNYFEKTKELLLRNKNILKEFYDL